MEKFSEYFLEEKLHETRHSIVYRGHNGNEHEPVIIKILKTEYPSPAEIARFRQEYNIIKELTLPGVVASIELVEYNNKFAIIEEDFNGISLKEIISSKKINIKAFLQIAIKVSKTLGSIHRENVIHLDIKPDNIIVNAASGNVKITDFGISTVLTRANEEIYNPEVIEGTLKYISPEQTGRMNRTVDYRTDLYSLGISFYEMLTGQVPFNSNDPMELIHSHIARQPVSPGELNPSIPVVITNIILKLLSKTPEERYQNSLGLLADLNECLTQLKKKNNIDEFPLAQKDISLKFNMPQILVGRDEMLEDLLFSFDIVARGGCEVMLVRGRPGIGKSALINEIHKPIVAKKGYYISGKYDQFRRDVPYSSIIQAFQGLIRQILSETQERIDSWKEGLLSAMGSNGKVITDVIPDLEYIIGKQPEIPDLGPEENQHRFNMVFQHFINVFTAKEHPLVLFLDDLQWADMASLNLLQTIVTGHERKYFFFVGAYRDNEVSGHHPLSLTLDEIKKKGKNIHSIVLDPLVIDHVNTMITNILRCKPEVSMPLSELVHRKTGGNPFFVNQFLKNLYEKDYFKLDSGARWKWDIDAIKKMQVTDNVVEFMTGKITTLPGRTQEILKICACIGNRFDLETLSIVSGTSIDTALDDITSALQEDLVSLHGEMYKFHHDRIQEAVYSLISEEDRKRMHYQIGRYVLDNTSEENLRESIIYIVNQLNRGKDYAPENERTEIARLNMTAGQKSIASSAYESALVFLREGVSLLPEDCWDKQYELAFPLYRDLMRCEYVNVNYDEAEKTFRLLVENSKSPVSTGEVYCLVLELKSTIGEDEEAIRLGVEGLNKIGIAELEENPPLEVLGAEIEKMKSLLADLRSEGKDLEDIVNFSHLEDQHLSIISKLMGHVGTSAVKVRPMLAAIVGLKIFNFLLDQRVIWGRSGYAMIGVGALGAILIKDFELALKCGKVGLELDKIFHDNDEARLRRGALHFLYAFSIVHWKEPVKMTIYHMLEGYKHSLEVGHLEWAGWCILAHYRFRIFSGENIDEICDEVNKFEDVFKDKDILTIDREFVEFSFFRSFITGEVDRDRLDDDVYNKTLEGNKKDNKVIFVLICLVIRIILNYYFENYEQCYTLCQEANQLAMAWQASYYMGEYYFFYSLVLAALSDDSSKAEQYKEELENNISLYQPWAEMCETNYLHRYQLIMAEKARVDKRYFDAGLLYHEAIHSARDNGFTNHEAIANECAGKFYLEHGLEDIARIYFTDARYCYFRWGATAKVKDLDEKYRGIIKTSEIHTGNAIVDGSTTTLATGTHGTRSLDLTSVIKTSQALSSEIDLGNLLGNIMKLSIENAGAEKGFLILENDEDKELFIEASGKAGGNIEVLTSAPVKDNTSLAVSLVNYTFKTGESLVLNDASNDKQFITDEYIHTQKPKSILCSPIRHKGSVSGVLYLENNLTTSAFTPERIEVLQIFSSQAAISIENSRLILARERDATLKAEMDIAANIQSSLLPDEPVIDGFEITAFLEPADDVGGDYYDFIKVDDKQWMVIGDVSGHGVPAGLLMMMVQSSIQTMLRKYPDLKPSELLNAVNETIKYNVTKMDNNRYMTITVFSFEDHGKILFSGLHQDLLIYRASSADVEVIQTEGIWLSPWDMKREGVDKILELNPGDILLLFTDGITEAMDAKRNIFSQERLIDILKHNSLLSTKEIREKILEALEDYTVDDDLTIVLLKKN